MGKHRTKSKRELGIYSKQATIDVMAGRYCDITHNNCFIRKLPYKRSRQDFNQYFFDMADLCCAGSQIVCMGKNEDGSPIAATHEQLAMYFDVEMKTISNIMYEMVLNGYMMRGKIGKVKFYIINPEYAIHKDGVSDVLLDMFNIDRNSIFQEYRDIQTSEAKSVTKIIGNKNTEELMNVKY